MRIYTEYTWKVILLMINDVYSWFVSFRFEENLLLEPFQACHLNSFGIDYVNCVVAGHTKRQSSHWCHWCLTQVYHVFVGRPSNFWRQGLLLKPVTRRLQHTLYKLFEIPAITSALEPMIWSSITRIRFHIKIWCSVFWKIGLCTA